MWFAVIPAQTGSISLPGTSPHIPHRPSTNNQKSEFLTESSRSKSDTIEPNGIYAHENHLSREKYKYWWFFCKLPQYLVEISCFLGKGYKPLPTCFLPPSLQIQPSICLDAPSLEEAAPRITRQLCKLESNPSYLVRRKTPNRSSIRSGQRVSHEGGMLGTHS
jgi:hypothetical protein